MKFDALATADRKDLVRLAELLEAGLLTPPMSALSLRDHMATAHAGPVAECLAKFSAEGMLPAHIALMLRAFAAGGQAAIGSSLPVELVVSGPNATGGARDTGVVMRQLFAKAREGVLAVGFVVHKGKGVFKTLADRLDNDDSFDATLCIDVRRQHGDTSIDRDIPAAFRERIRSQRMAWKPIATRLLRPPVAQSCRGVRPVRCMPSASLSMVGRHSLLPRISPRRRRRETSSSACS